MEEFGERLGVPVISFIDTLGAKPTLEAEYAGQSREIARSTQAGNTYKYPFLTYIVGVGGSGGAIGTMGISDNVSMLSDSHLYVAEPSSAASIVYSTSKPTVDQIKDTIVSLRPTAHDQKELGLIDDVINVPGGKAKRDLGTVAAIRNHIIHTFPKFAEMAHHRKLEHHRDKKMKDLEGMPLEPH